jgi:phenylalanyl-tRNA synthetase beta chain
MPTISINRKDFEQLLGQPTTVEELDALLALVKGEVKDRHADTGEWRIELQDGNRPDLWSCEGIARQFRIKLKGAASAYRFFKPSTHPKHRVEVAPGMERVRPYLAACTAVGYPVTEEGLVQLIQTQEKLADLFGRKRRTVSIGLYRLSQIVFPVTYALAKPEEARFTPLGFEEPLSLAEILARHPKGLEYGAILAGHECLPLLRDKDGRILSLPPIINSREVGEVQVGDRELFVEVTGTDLRMVILTLNILAVNLADRGATIGAVEVQYPYATDLGAILHTPLDFGKSRSIPIKTIETALGQTLGAQAIQMALTGYGYEARASRDKVSVKLPPYRNDLMHAADVVEDVAISSGYGQFSTVMPSAFTVGGLSRLEELSDRIRELMVGYGYQEMISNIMASRQELVSRMRLTGTEWDRIVEVDNPVSQTFSCLRQWIIPCLLRVEAASARAFYPHRIFEVGEVEIPDPAHDTGSRTVLSLGALLAHASASFSEIQSCLDLLFFYLECPYTLEPISHPSFLEGRAGRVVSEGRSLGLIGELHPEVLELWQVGMPSVVFELEVDRLIER